MASVVSKAWPAPAKINRFLHITGRREDGYHLLQTVFQFLDYSDTIDFRLRDDGQIRMLTPIPGVADEDNLMIHAALLLQAKAADKLGVDIMINKRLPMGGGLGGGSSDAATVLLALNHLWQLGYGAYELSDMGLHLGADIPVFVQGHAAWAEGIGEKLQVITLDEPWFCVIVPPIHVSTAEIFSDPELTRNTSPIKIADFLQGAGRNDCETRVTKRFQEVADVIAWMQAHADHLPACVLPTRMTGTGACVFTAMQTEQDARKFYEQLPAGWQAFIAKGLNQSPLYKRLQQEQALLA